MTQLKSDNEAFGSKLYSLSKAKKSIMLSLNINLKIKKIKSKDSLNKIVADTIIAPINVPPHSNSAVDGYAIKFKDLKTNNNIFYLAGKSKAGKPYKKLLNTNETVRVLTGAIIPKNADTVVMEEDCIINNKKIILPDNIKKGINYRKYGEDLKKNRKVFDKGHKIKPQDIGILSSLGINSITSFQDISIALFSCGDELTDPKRNIKMGKIYDSNKAMLIAFFQMIGVKIVDLGIIPDNPKKIIQALNIASKSNLIISSGAMSLGDEDHIKKIIEKHGNLKIWRLAIKPGRPVGFGHYKNTNFLGLPGNPAAAFVTFMILGIPIIKKLRGEKHSNYNVHEVPVNFHHTKKSGRKEFIRVKLDSNKYVLNKFSKTGAGILSSTSWANGLGIINEDITVLKPNDKIIFISFNDLVN